MLESVYQAKLIKKLRKMFPDCIILKNDTAYLQGMLDLSIFYGTNWGMLEVKSHEGAPEQPNQRYYVELLNEMSFAAFIYPENEEEVLNDLSRAFQSSRQTRVS